MKVIITDEAYSVLEDALDFLIKVQKIPVEKAIEIGDKLIDTAENIHEFPFSHQEEESLKHLKFGHRRVIKRDFKIIYKIVEETIFVTDFFHSHRNPKQMKG